MPKSNNKSNMPVPQTWSGQDKRFGETLKNNVDVLAGFNGDPLDKAVTMRALLDSGIVSLASGYGAYSGASSSIAPRVDIPNLDVPPAPYNLAANGAFQNILLSWSLAGFKGFAYQEVFRHTSDSIADATLVGVTSASRGFYTDSVGESSSYYYWVRAVNQNGLAGPFNSSTGTLGETAPDVQLLLDTLNGAITESELATDLQTEIDKISGDINVTGSVAAQVAAEATARATALSNEATARATAISGEATARAEALSDEAAARAAAVGNEATARAAAISGEATARVAAVSGEATARATAIADSADVLQAQLNDLTGITAWDSAESYSIDDKVRHDDKLWSAEAANSNSEPTYSNNASTNSDWELTGDYTSLASVTAGNSASILAINNISTDSNSAAAVAIKSLNGEVFAADGSSLLATGSALTGLTTDVRSIYTEADGDTPASGILTSVQSDVTSLNGEVFAADGTSLLATGSALSGLTTDVRDIYTEANGDTPASGILTSVQSDVTDLNGEVFDSSGASLLATGSALSDLTTSVESIYTPADGDTPASGVLASVQSDVTDLNGEVFAADGASLLATGSAVSGLTTDVRSIYTAADNSVNPAVPASGILASVQSDVTDLNAEVFAANGASLLATGQSVTSLTNNVNAIYDADGDVDDDGNAIPSGVVASAQAAITALNGAVFDSDGVSQLATGSSLTAVDNKVLAIYDPDDEDAVTQVSSIQSSLTNLQGAVFDENDEVKLASGSAVTTLTNDVNAIYDADGGEDDANGNPTPSGILSSAQASITSLQGAVFDENNGVKLATTSALTALTNAVNNTATGLVATAGNLTSLETAVFNDMTGVANWNDSTAYAIGDKVISGKKLYRAIAVSTNEVPPNSTYWDLDTLSSASAITELSTTLTDDYATAAATGLLLAQKETSGAAAQALTDAQAYADDNFATSSQLTNLESATFGNLTGLSAYDEDTTYAVGDRVTHGVGVLKKIYVATQASSASDKQAPTVSAYWDEDTLASLAVTNAALGGKETSGAAAQALQDSKTYTDTNAASATEFTALNAAVFEDVAGVNAWSSATNYAIGARVYFGRKIYRAVATSNNVEPDTDTSKWLTDSAASASALAALDTKVNDDYTTASDLTDLLALKINATQSATNIAQAITNSEATASSTYATAANLNSLESSIFADLINVSGWVGTSAGVTAVNYVAGNFVTHDGKLFKALAASTNVEPSTDATKWEQDTLTTADQVEAAYAKSSAVSVLQSNIFNSLTGVADWSASPTYAVGSRVVYTETNGVKKLYKALIANSNTTPHNNISGSNPKWALDTIASALVVSALDTKVTNDYSTTDTLSGQFSAKENAGTAAGLLQSYTTTSAQNTATSNAVEAAYAAIFTEMTGLPDWDTTTTYAVGARVVHRATSTADRKVYKALIASTNATPHNNIAGSNPKWELDTLAFAGALSTLDATVNADDTGLVDKTDAIELRIDNVGGVTMEQKFTAQATDIGDLESQYTVKIDSNGHVAGFGLANTTTASGSNTSEFYVNADRFAITPNLTSTAPAFVVLNSYSTGDYVTYGDKLWRFKLLSDGQPVSNFTVNHANLGPGGTSGMAPYLWEEAGQTPFAVVAASTVDGVYIPAGVYMDTAFIRDGTITTAQIGTANIDTANITGTLSANRISGGTIDASTINIEGVGGTFNIKSSATGARTEMTASRTKVFDATGQLRVVLGDLSV